MFGEFIPEDQKNFESFLLHLRIIDLIFATSTSKENIDYIRHLLREHHWRFVQLYPEIQVTPKIHYNIHCPDWMLRLK